MFYQSPEYTRAVIADREREIQQMRLIRQAKRARSEARNAEPRRKRTIRLRRPVRA